MTQSQLRYPKLRSESPKGFFFPYPVDEKSGIEEAISPKMEETLSRFALVLLLVMST